MNWFDNGEYDDYEWRTVHTFYDISKLAKYWASEEMAKEIANREDEVIEIALYDFAFSKVDPIINQISYLKQLLKKEWFR
jgi:hypothetical protein